MCSHSNRLIEVILVHTIYHFNIKKKENRHKLSQVCSYGIFSQGLKNEFETALVNELSVLEQLRLYCIRMLGDKTAQ